MDWNLEFSEMFGWKMTLQWVDFPNIIPCSSILYHLHHILKANNRKSFRNTSLSSTVCQNQREVQWLEGFLMGLLPSLERLTSWLECFLWTFSLGRAQLSKYNCHMLRRFGSRCRHSGENSHVSGFVEVVVSLLCRTKDAGWC